MNIEQRFAHLERSNRRLRTGLLSLTIAITTILIVGQAKPEKVPDVIKAKQFQVVNDKGLPVAHLANLAGAGGLALMSDKRKAIVALGATDDGEGFVSTYNDKGQELVALGVLPGGEGLVETFNDKGQRLARLGVLKDGGGVVVTYIGDGRVTGSIGNVKD